MEGHIKIGDNLKSLRLKKSMTQAQLAEIIFLTPQAISKWECNKSLPDIPTLIVLSELYGVSTDEILGRSKEKFLESIFRKKKGVIHMLKKLVKTVYPNMYIINVTNDLFNFNEYPELNSMGVWVTLDAHNYKLIINDNILNNDTKKNDEDYVKNLFQIITNLNASSFTVERTYQTPGFSI